MAYIDIQNGDDADILRRRKRLQMQQLSYESDLKRLLRETEAAQQEIQRITRERDRLTMQITDHERRVKKLEDKEIFLRQESDHVKKQIINLGQR